MKSDKQIRILNFVKDNEGCTIPDIEAFTDCSRAIVNTLIKNGYLELVEQKIDINLSNICGVKDISGTKTIADFPFFNTLSINCKYTSVFPEPVTPYNKNSSYSSLSMHVETLS